MSAARPHPDIPPGKNVPAELVTVKCRRCRKWLCRPETMPAKPDGAERYKAPFADIAAKDGCGWCYCAWCEERRQAEAEAARMGEAYRPMGPRRDHTDRRRSADRIHATDDNPWYETAARAMEESG